MVLVKRDRVEVFHGAQERKALEQRPGMVGQAVEELLHSPVRDVLQPLRLDAALDVAPEHQLLHVGPESLLAVGAGGLQKRLDGVVDVVVVFLDFMGLAAQEEIIQNGGVIPSSLGTEEGAVTDWKQVQKRGLRRHSLKKIRLRRGIDLFN